MIEVNSRTWLGAYATQKGVDIIYSPNNGRINFPIELSSAEAKQFINLIRDELEKSGHII